MNCVVLGLGSNRSFNGLSSIELLRSAVEQLFQFIDDLVCSSVYCTKPMYVENQDDFYNMVVIGNIKDDICAQELLERIHIIENLLGRDRSKEIRFGPRSIDIDIEFFGEQNIHTEELQIPHLRLQERGFVLKPLLEVLKQNADVYKGEKLKKIVSVHANSTFSDVDFFMDSKTFLGVQIKNEVQNGNGSKRGCKN